MEDKSPIAFTGRSFTPICAACRMSFRREDEVICEDECEGRMWFYHAACVPESLRERVKMRALHSRPVYFVCDEPAHVLSASATSGEYN